MNSKNLEPLALFGMLLVGNQAINVSAIASVTEVSPTDYRLHMLTGDDIALEDDDAKIFVEQLQSIMRHAQFGGGAVNRSPKIQ